MIRIQDGSGAVEVEVRDAIVLLLNGVLMKGVGMVCWRWKDNEIFFAAGTGCERKRWLATGPAEEIDKLKLARSFFRKWTEELRCGLKSPSAKPVYPGTPEFLPFLLKHVL